tara:strand:- start:2909 stop:5284 length:2376 start_codon:yes stop_codon:yes gene_type:complete
MGGRAGHMSHLYDDPMLTFGSLKRVFKTAAVGELRGTEKTDGQNISVSYSVKRGEVVAIRNDDHAFMRGFNTADLMNYMAASTYDEKSGDYLSTFKGLRKGRSRKKRETPVHVRNAYSQAMSTFEKFAQSLPADLQIKFFGEDANIFYNAEVMSASSRNAINYDVESLLIHRVGHEVYDEENRDTAPMAKEDAEKKAKALEAYLENFYNTIEGEGMSLQVGAIIQLKALATDAILQQSMTRLDKFMASNNMKDNNNIGQLIIEGLEKIVNQSFPDLDVESRKLLYRRMYAEYYDIPGGESKKVRGIDNRSIFSSIAGITPEIQDLIKKLVSRSKEIIKNILETLEDIIHDFSVEMLKSLESTFILGVEGDRAAANRAEVEELRKRISHIINTVENSNSDEARLFLAQQMKKLKNVDKIVTAAEGFVFDFDGHTYKFTGNFAPMNQLLGLQNFPGSRPGIPADLFADVGPDIAGPVATKPINEAFVNKGNSFMFVPGGFKPPHKGHLYLLKTAIKRLPGAKPFLVTGETPRDGITLEQAMQVWKLYLQSEPNINIDELSIITVPQGGLAVLDTNGQPIKNNDGAIRLTNSPLQAIYNSAISLPKNAKVYIVSSKADPGHAAIGGAIKEARPDLTVVPFEVATLDDPKSGEKFSATLLRRSILDGNLDEFRRFLPPNKHVLNQARYIFYNILKAQPPADAPEAEPEEESGPLAENFRTSDIYRLVDETIEEMSAMAGGSVAMGAGTPWKSLDAEKENKKEKKRQKLKKSKTKGEKEKMVDEIMNYLLSTEALL